MFSESQKDEMLSLLGEYVNKVTRKAPKGGYVCPLCGSGTGVHKSGAFSIDKTTPTRWKCFSCNAGGDVFDLIGAVEGITDFSGQILRAGEIFGITPESENAPKHSSLSAKPVIVQTENPPADYTDFFKAAHANINAPAALEYLKTRGLSMESAKRWNLGYIENWKHPAAPAAVPASPRLIVPTSCGSYLARDIRPNITQFAKQKVGNISLFNANALENSTRPIYIVEGELDAISVMQAGGAAVALGSTSMAKRFIAQMLQNPPKVPLIIALDSDASGEGACEQIYNALHGSMRVRTYRPFEGVKDCNDMLIKFPERFAQMVKRGEDFSEPINEREREEYREIFKDSAAANLPAFLDKIKSGKTARPIPTCFPALNNVLDGGLFAGLYVIGGISSVGKTSFVEQVSDFAAAAGVDILFFSLEMSREELMSKSISRHTLEIVQERGISTQNAKTARGITRSERYDDYSELEKDIIGAAVERYKSYAGRVFLIEGVGNTTAESIRQTVARHISFTGNKPLVIVDYLQIIAPEKGQERATDKQITDYNVSALKRVSRDCDVPVIVISSLNRMSYNTEIGLSAFKESGGIEYSADTVLGLQLKGAGKSGFDVNVAKKAEPREIEIIVLKNRFGAVGDVVNLNFYALFNFFTESSAPICAEYDF